MKNNRKIFGRTFLTVPILVLLFAAALIPVDTTLGKYHNELDELGVDANIEIPLADISHDPGGGGDGPGIFDETPTTVYQVQPGDTLATIAEKFNTTVEALIAYNNLEAPYKIEVGIILRIPPADYVVPEIGTGEPTPPGRQQSLLQTKPSSLKANWAHLPMKHRPLPNPSRRKMTQTMTRREQRERI